MIDEKILKEIIEYCDINNITDVKNKINEFLRIGFNIEKYGDSPFYEKPIMIEKTKEINEEKVEKIEKEIKEEKPKKRVRIIKN